MKQLNRSQKFKAVNHIVTEKLQTTDLEERKRLFNDKLLNIIIASEEKNGVYLEKVNPNETNNMV